MTKLVINVLIRRMFTPLTWGQGGGKGADLVGTCGHAKGAK